MDWNDDTISLLRSLWDQGLSTAEIGRRMQITKNAVVGKAHRLDLPARPSPIRKMLDAVAGPAGAAVPAPARTLPALPAASGLKKDETALNGGVVSPIAVSAGRRAEVVPLVAEPRTAGAGRMPAGPAAGSGTVHMLRPVMLPVPPRSAEPEAIPEALAEPKVSAPVRAAMAADAGTPAPRRRGLTCCWPLGEPGTKEFHFCGGEPTPGKPYCTEHAALAYVKVRDRRDSVA